jgi:hypothetical protein
MAEPNDALAAEPVHDAVARIARSVDGSVDRSVDVASRARFIERATARRGSSRGGRKAWRALAIAASIVAAVSVAELARRSRQVVRAPAPLMAVGRELSAPSHPVELSIADGSRIIVLPATRARVVASDAHGAQIALSHGTLSLEIQHRPETRWSVVAGVVHIHVTGTRFEARRSAADEVVDVQLFDGSLSVSIGDRQTVQMRAGQRLHVDGALGERVSLDEIQSRSDSGIAARSEIDADAALAAADAAVSEPSTASRRRVEPSTARWNLLALQGDFAAVLRAARSHTGDLSQRGIDELTALAEAGRHEGDLAWTETAYEAIRDRHLARTGDRAEAVFACGRTAEDAGDLGRAVEWFRRYENDFPDGRRGAEAIGRQFVIEQRRGRISRAQELARRYLIREGGGPYAARAHALLLD